MTKALDLFAKHLEYLRKEAERKGIHFSEILSMVADDPPAKVLRKEAKLSLHDRVEPIIQRYLPQFYEFLANEFAEINQDQWEMLKLNRKVVNAALNAHNKQKAELDIGRKKGVEKRRATATERQRVLAEAIRQLFDKPEKPGWGWSNDEIVSFLKPKINYKESTILAKVKKDAAMYRKARKERQAREFPLR